MDCGTARSPSRHPIVHFTHVRNLPGILAAGCLQSDNLVERGPGLLVEAADLGIKASRRTIPVPLAPFGCVADYVPFYFAGRSPMLYKIARGGLPNYTEGQDPLIYLVSTVEAVIGAGLRWLFSDGNCAATVTQVFDDPQPPGHRCRLAGHAGTDVEQHGGGSGSYAAPHGGVPRPPARPGRLPDRGGRPHPGPEAAGRADTCRVSFQAPGAGTARLVLLNRQNRAVCMY